MPELDSLHREIEDLHRNAVVSHLSGARDAQHKAVGPHLLRARR